MEPEECAFISIADNRVAKHKNMINEASNNSNNILVRILHKITMIEVTVRQVR